MKPIRLVTGNAGKLKECLRLFPTDIQPLAVDIDLEEIRCQPGD